MIEMSKLNKVIEDLECLIEEMGEDGYHGSESVIKAHDHLIKYEDLLSYDEAKEREIFESTYPLDNGVTWRAEDGNEGRYCVWIDCKGGFWACVNAAFGFQQKWEVWSKCAKSRARSAE